MENSFNIAGALACFLGATTMLAGVQDGLSLAAYTYQADYVNEFGRQLNSTSGSYKQSPSYSYNYTYKGCYNMYTKFTDYTKNSYKCSQLNFASNGTNSSSNAAEAGSGIFGGLCCLAIIIIIIVICCKRKKKTTTTVTKEQTVI